MLPGSGKEKPSLVDPLDQAIVSQPLKMEAEPSSEMLC